jgi:hypothetical protein
LIEFVLLKTKELVDEVVVELVVDGDVGNTRSYMLLSCPNKLLTGSFGDKRTDII